MNFKDQYFYKRITLAAGAVSQPFAVRANTLMIKPYGSTAFTDAIEAKFDNGPFSPYPSGVGISLEDVDQNGNLKPYIFERIQFKNSGGGSLEFSVLAFMGSSVDNNNLAIDGSVTVQSGGVPTAGASISAVVGGATRAISAAAKGVIVYCESNPVYLKDTSNQIIGHLEPGDMATFPFQNFTLKLVGDGGTSTVYVTEII